MTSKNSNKSLASFTPFNLPANEDKLKEVARKELGETEELKEERLRQLKALIKDNNVACITRDDFLLRFLRTKKFNVQRSFQAVQNYAKQRAALDHRLQKLQPETVKRFLSQNFIGFLPYRDAEGRLVLFVTTGAWNSDICPDEEVARLLLLMSYYAAEKQSSQITGIPLICDCTHFPLTFIPHVLKHARTISNVLFNGLPVRYPAMNIINEGPIMKFGVSLIYPLIPKKIKERILFHGKTREMLFEQFVPAILPEEAGGSLEPFSCDHLTEEMLDFLKKFKDEQRHFLV